MSTEGADNSWAYSKLSLQSTPDTRILQGARGDKDERKIFARLKAELEAKSKSKRFSNPFDNVPVDAHSKIYIAFLLSGIGYMLPYTCFIVAVDYYQSRFPHTTIVFDMTATTIVVGMLGVILNNVLVETLSLTWRVMFGYVISISLLLFLTICDVTLNLFDHDTGYWVTMTGVAVIAVGCAVQQSSFYGYANMLPRRYTQGVMAGESVAGVLVSFNRIVTKLMLDDEKINTIIFFICSIVVILICCGTFFLARWTHFVQHHLRSCKTDDSYERQDTEFKLQRGTRNSHAGTYDSENGPVTGFNGYVRQQPETLQQPDVVHSVCLSDGREESGAIVDVPSGAGDLGSSSSLVQDKQLTCKGGLSARWEVVKQIYPYMTSFAVTFYVSVSLYPGIISEVFSCRLGTWMPVVLMACFNVTDAFGKMLTAVKHNYTKLRLLIYSLARIALIPLVVLCIIPRARPTLSGEAWSIFITILLGVTNGFFGSLPMVLAPAQVAPRLRELCGNTMMLSFTAAIVAGAFTSYGLDLLVGPHPDLEICHKNASLYRTGDVHNSSFVHT
ncbi:equilibrative nucleoside transporter 4-like [Physella acuta]|uniref:equilibrative nucleoside transporter 4-like n=1 Tax=Physella acuta TaxID=109671 RepID=UPI0027DE9673|nr:equilibrative nucleoside transporter 4-like [Physella acuta]